jgi:hypothetical protein
MTDHLTERRTRHDRTEHHFGEMEAALVELAAAIDIYPAGATLEDVLAAVDARLTSLENAVLVRFGLDAIIRVTRTGSFGVDAVLAIATVAGSFTADAVVRATQAASFAANAVIKTTPSASFTTDAVIMPLFTLDAVIAPRFTLDAVISDGVDDGDFDDDDFDPADFD